MLSKTISRAFERLFIPDRNDVLPKEDTTSVWTPARTIPDPDRIVRGNPTHPGHDADGFRNPMVLEQADICVLGGSMAYGAGVGPEQCWPRLLDWLSPSAVYNASQCGWGPLQAAIGLERELKRNPSSIILTLHTGDARRAFKCAARSGHSLARSVWQSEYSRIAMPSLLVKDMAAKALILEERARPEASPGEILATLSERGVPDFNRFELDGSRFYLTENACGAVQKHRTPTVEAGFRILNQCVEHIAHKTASVGAELLIMIMPSREYLAYVCMDRAEVRSPDSLRRLGEIEGQTIKRLHAACDNAKARSLDMSDVLLPHMGTRIFPQDSRDGHPNPKGCRIIAENVARIL